MKRQRLSAQLDPDNGGVLLVYLQGQPGRGSREVVDDLERSSDTDCTIM